MNRKIIWGCLVLLLTVFVVTWRCYARPRPALETSYWYWHSPFRIGPAQKNALTTLGVKRLFVRAGTFTTDGKNILLNMPQEWETKSDLPVHLVFNFDAGVVRHFEEFSVDLMVEDISTRILKQLADARKIQSVQGIQFDFDCPTRLLPRYAELVKKIKKRMRQDLEYSATGLMSWLGTQGARTLSRELDFLVPQAYEGETGLTLDKLRPVGDLAELRRLLPRIEQLECEVYMGLPAYGHAFLFDQQGKLVSMFRDLTPMEAMKHPAFEFVSAYPSDRLGKQAKTKADWIGEEIIIFKSIKPGIDGRGKGFTLAYTVPTASLLDQAQEIVRENQPSNCRGFVIYRIPDDNSPLALPLIKPADRPMLKVTLKLGSESYGAIETGNSKMPLDVFLHIQNASSAPTFIAPDAVVVKVNFDVPGIESVQLGDALWSKVLSPNMAQLGLGYLAPGEKVEIGPIRLTSNKASKATIDCKIRDSSGFDISTRHSWVSF